MTLPNELIRHLSRVYDDIVASSYPQTFSEVCAHYERGAWVADADMRAHYLLIQDERAPHRASVSVAVEACARGGGRGLAQLDSAAKFAAGMRGCEWLDGWLWEDNTAALAMDMRFGFGIIGRIADAWRHPDGTPRHMLLVTKRIG